jgi:hypothetical protein
MSPARRCTSHDGRGCCRSTIGTITTFTIDSAAATTTFTDTDTAK